MAQQRGESSQEAEVAWTRVAAGSNVRLARG